MNNSVYIENTLYKSGMLHYNTLKVLFSCRVEESLGISYSVLKYVSYYYILKILLDIGVRLKHWNYYTVVRVAAHQFAQFKA